jgi:hypothetical protein
MTRREPFFFSSNQTNSHESKSISEADLRVLSRGETPGRRAGDLQEPEAQAAPGLAAPERPPNDHRTINQITQITHYAEGIICRDY